MIVVREQKTKLTSGTNEKSAVAAAQTPEEAAANVTATTTDNDVNNNVSNHKCWLKDQIMYFCSQNNWLIFKDHKLGSKICILYV